MKTAKCLDGSEISVYCAHTEMVLTDLLKGNPKNPNKHPVSQIELLGKVIKEQGWRAPITVSKRSGMIVKGHGRLEAAKMIECEKCPVDYQDYETEVDEIADLMADNKIAELANIDVELELSAKQFLINEEFDLELAGFSFEINEDNDESSCGDGDAVDVDDETRLEVILSTESEQEKLYNELTERGYTCRVLKL